MSSTYVCAHAGTSAETFTTFIQDLLRRLPAFPPKVFLWDNLKAHYAPEVFETVYAAGHSIRPRPPYCPQDGPIEYVFNNVEMNLTFRMYEIRDNADLERNIYDTIAGIGDTDPYFVHCGYGM